VLYYITINLNIIKGDIEHPEFTELSLCLYKSGAERCNFSISYSDAYDKVLEKNKNGKISVSVIEKDEKFVWKA